MKLTPVELIIEHVLQKQFNDPLYRRDLLLGVQTDMALLPVDLMHIASHFEQAQDSQITAKIIQSGGESNHQLLNDEGRTLRQRSISLSIQPYGKVVIYSQQHIVNLPCSLDNATPETIEQIVRWAEEQHQLKQMLIAEVHDCAVPRILIRGAASPEKGHVIQHAGFDEPVHQTNLYIPEQFALRFLRELHASSIRKE